MEEEKKTSRKKKTIIWLVTIVLFIILILWFSLTMYNYYRVSTERKPILCFGDTREIESNNEYSRVCHGIFYKYKEYYSKKNDVITAREFTLFFKEFDRKS